MQVFYPSMHKKDLEAKLGLCVTVMVVFMPKMGTYHTQKRDQEHNRKITSCFFPGISLEERQAEEDAWLLPFALFCAAG